MKSGESEQVKDCKDYITSVVFENLTNLKDLIYMDNSISSIWSYAQDLYDMNGRVRLQLHVSNGKVSGNKKKYFFGCSKKIVDQLKEFSSYKNYMLFICGYERDSSGVWIDDNIYLFLFPFEFICDKEKIDLLVTEKEQIKYNIVLSDGIFKLKKGKYEWNLKEYQLSIDGLIAKLDMDLEIKIPVDYNIIRDESHKISRDTILARDVKALYNFECQICGYTITFPDGERYAETHHIQPLSPPHNGPDKRENIICVCPNHHVELDYGVIKIDKTKLKIASGHIISDEYINYHNLRLMHS